jgi:hypothetical protein
MTQPYYQHLLVESTAMQYIPSWAHSSSHITLSGTGLQQLQLL